MRIDKAWLESLIQPDGGLYDLGWYVAWDVGEPKATLDGTFTAAQLRAVADYMDSSALHKPT